MISIFVKAVPILEKIEAAGFEAYFVGGCVRDYILGRGISDVDIATSATPLEIKEIFPKTVDVGIEHGTVVVIWDKETYELTTFRTDGEYTDFRRPSQVSFIRNLTDDLRRRDFTMNSIAMDKEGKLIDPFSGQQAIRNKIIETVGASSERFSEDALRMMRAVRFVSQLSFSISPATNKALKENAHLLDKIAVERKTQEFEKLLQGNNRRNALEILLDSGLFLYLPGLNGHENALNHLILLDLSRLSSIEMWSLLLYLMEIQMDQAEIFLRKWKLPVKKIREIKEILYWLYFRCISDWGIEALYKATLKNVIHVEKLFNIIHHQDVSKSLSALKEQYELLIIKGRKDLAVTGLDLMKWEERKEGSWIKERLTTIEKAVLNGQVQNNRNKIKEWLLKCNQS